MKRRKRLAMFVIAAGLAVVLHNWLGSPFFSKHLFTSISPDRRYKLDIYSEKRWQLVTAPGDGGNRYIHAILRNRWGWKIGETNRACAPSDYDVYEADGIRGDLVGGEVWFAPARGIDLKTGRCEM